MNKILIALFTFFVLKINAQTTLPLFKDGKVSKEVFSTLKASKTDAIRIDIPGKPYGLTLEKSNILAEDFKVVTSKGKTIRKVDGVFYRGKVEGQSNSVATVSIYEDEVVCTYSNDTGNFEIAGKKSKPYTMRQIPFQREVPFECYTSDSVIVRTNTVESPLLTCRSVKVYFEADYKLYQDKGSNVTNTVNYVTSLFNQVATLYANEQIVIQISEIKVWNSPDPYIPYTSTGSVLNKFRSDLNGNFNGNLAHLLSTRSLGGGIAYVDVLCFKQYGVGVSAIQTSFHNVPTYSWSVEVVTHELGHNFGSWHTHSCNWPNGALDNCYTPEGSCPTGPPPVNGGTIMSYCHLTQYGINFANGFGTVPGNHIRNKYNTASCLTGNSAAPTNLQTNNVTNTTATVSWASVPGTQAYTLQYKQVTGGTWTTVNTGLNTSYNITGLAQNTQYHWQVKTDCSAYTTLVVFTTTGSGGSCSTVLVPSFTNITQGSVLVFWVPIQGVTAYHLQYKTVAATNWIEYGYIPGTSLTLNNLTPNTTYMVRVRPDCNANWGTIKQFTTLSGGNNCPAPNNLQNTNITSISTNLSWSPQTGITGYYIGIKLQNQTNWFTLGPISYNAVVISGLQPGTTYNWRIRNNCSDWSATATFTTLANLPQTRIEVIPNPTTGTFKLEGYTGRAILMDSLGVKVLDLNLDGSDVDISILPFGVYYLRVGEKIYKIVKI